MTETDLIGDDGNFQMGFMCLNLQETGCPSG